MYGLINVEMYLKNVALQIEFKFTVKKKKMYFINFNNSNIPNH